MQYYFPIPSQRKLHTNGNLASWMMFHGPPTTANLFLFYYSGGVGGVLASGGVGGVLASGGVGGVLASGGVGGVLASGGVGGVLASEGVGGMLAIVEGLEVCWL